MSSSLMRPVLVVCFCLLQLLSHSHSFDNALLPRYHLRAPTGSKGNPRKHSFRLAKSLDGPSHSQAKAASSSEFRAEKDVSDDSTNDATHPPSYAAIARFTLPVSVICLTNFVSGAIDTASVGRFGGTIQLGALSPATAGLEYVCYAFACLPQSTLVLLGSANDEKDRQKTLSVAMVVALVVGLGQGLVSFGGASQLMRALGAGPEMLPFAVPYVQIRALSLWAYYLTMVGSASCFSQKDSFTPFWVTLLAGGLNFAGNYVLCRKMTVTTAGAAIATAVSQYTAAAITMLVLWKRKQLPDLAKIGMPRLRELLRFVGFAGKISVYTFVRIFVYGFCSRMCTLLGAVSAAASQVATNVWWGGSSFTAEPLESAILAFLPRQLGSQNTARKDESGAETPESTLAWSPRATTTLMRHLRFAVGISALVTAGLLGAMAGNNLSWLLNDPSVLVQIPRGALGTMCFVVGPMLVLEGALLTLRRVGWVTAVSAAAAIVSCGSMVLGRRLVRGASVGFFWWMVSLFVGLRFVGNALGVYRFARKHGGNASPAP